MPKKNAKDLSLNSANQFVVLRDTKTSSLHVFSSNHLSYAKRDNLNVGTYATFKGGGDATGRCRGTILTSGTKQQCEHSISAIEQSENSNSHNANSDEIESELSDELHIDKCVEKNDLVDDGNELLKEKNGLPASVSASERTIVDMNTCGDSSISTSTTLATNDSGTTVQPLADSSNSEVLKNISNNIDTTKKRKQVSAEPIAIVSNGKRPMKVSCLEHKRLKRENMQLKKEINMYKDNWMPKPSGAAAVYLIGMGKVLSGVCTNEEGEEDRGEKLEWIKKTLAMSEKQLKLSEHPTDITKTCRQIIKHVYPKCEERAAMLISSLDTDQLRAIQDYAKMVHPAQSKINLSVLNNAIGNVFATEKHKLDRNAMGQEVVDGQAGDTDDSEDIDE